MSKASYELTAGEREGITCQYCSKTTAMVEDKDVYATSYGGYVMVCRPCGAHVGCHPPGPFEGQSLGSVANRELRQARKAAHAAFDPLWLRASNKAASRVATYSQLTAYLKLPSEHVHIGIMNEVQCQQVVDFAKSIQDKIKQAAQYRQFKAGRRGERNAAHQARRFHQNM